MKRREILASLGAAAAAAGTFAYAAADEGKKKAPSAHDHHVDPCAATCSACAVECEACRRHCEDEVIAGHKDHFESMRLCADCADICAVCSAICARGGPLEPVVREACAKACDQCATACGKFDDPRMKACAEACKKCAAECAKE